MLNPDSEDAPNLSDSTDRNAIWLSASQEMPYSVPLQSLHTSNSPEEIAPTVQNQFPQRPLCRNGSSLSSGEEDGHTSNSYERPPRPLCEDGSSLSSYEADETISAQDSTVATLDSYAPTYDDTSSSSESEHGNNVLARLPEQLAVQSPQVLVENSTDVHVGPHFQYNGPITVKQYISLDGNKAIENDSTTSPLPAQMPHMKGIANVLLNPGGKQGIDNDAFDPGSPHLNNGISAINVSEDPLYNSKGDIEQGITFFLKKHYIYISLFVITVTVICIILGVTLAPSYKDINSISKNIRIFCDKKDIVASEGDKQVKWVVDVDSLIGELQVTWYDPNCKKIEQTKKYEFQTIPKPDGNFQAVLTLFDLDKNDQGLYKLHVYNNNDEDWEYFTLKVNGNGPVDRIVACYVCEWASLRTGLGKFTVDDVDPTQCTHLLYAFANFNEDTNSIESKNPSYDLGKDNEPGAYKKMTSFKQKHPNLKVLISMGGWAERESKDYSAMAESKERRKLFINSVVHFLRKHNFDGLDLHWQFPAEAKNGKPADKNNFAILVKELKEEFKKNNENWLLTAPLGVIPDTIKNAYNVPEISKHLDYMFALCYSYHGSWELKTGPNAPLKPMQPGDKFNVESSILTLLRAGAPPSKLVLGVQLYGRNFLLKNDYDGKGFGDPADGNFFGPYVQEAGTYGYNEICHALGEKNSLWKTYWDNVTHTPFMVRNKQFMSYDNDRSLTDKMELAREKNLAGVSVYALDTDDFQGNCAFEKTGVSNYPLMRLINRALAFGPMKRCEVETFPQGKSRNTDIPP